MMEKFDYFICGYIIFVIVALLLIMRNSSVIDFDSVVVVGEKQYQCSEPIILPSEKNIYHNYINQKKSSYKLAVFTANNGFQIIENDKMEVDGEHKVIFILKPDSELVYH